MIPEPILAIAQGATTRGARLPDGGDPAAVLDFMTILGAISARSGATVASDDAANADPAATPPPDDEALDPAAALPAEEAGDDAGDEEPGLPVQDGQRDATVTPIAAAIEGPFASRPDGAVPRDGAGSTYSAIDRPPRPLPDPWAAQRLSPGTDPTGNGPPAVPARPAADAAQSSQAQPPETAARARVGATDAPNPATTVQSGATGATGANAANAGTTANTATVQTASAAEPQQAALPAQPRAIPSRPGQPTALQSTGDQSPPTQPQVAGSDQAPRGLTPMAALGDPATARSRTATAEADPRQTRDVQSLSGPPAPKPVVEASAAAQPKSAGLAADPSAPAGDMAIGSSVSAAPELRAEAPRVLSLSDLPSAIVQKIREMIAAPPPQSAGTQRTEITLSPVELGRLTFVIRTEDGVLNLHVLVERPETLELVRRHADALERAASDGPVRLRLEQEGAAQQGRDGAQHQDRQGSHAPGSQAPDTASPPATENPAARAAFQAWSAPGARLDIRL